MYGWRLQASGTPNLVASPCWALWWAAAIAAEIHIPDMHRAAFPLVSDRVASKRTRTEEIAMFNRSKETFPLYHVVHSEKTDKQARTVSLFVVSKTLTNTLGTG